MARLFLGLISIFSTTAGAADPLEVADGGAGPPASVEDGGDRGDDAEAIRRLELYIVNGEASKAKTQLEELVDRVAHLPDEPGGQRLFRFAGYAVELKDPGFASSLYDQAAQAFDRTGNRKDSAIAAVNALQARLDNANFNGLARAIESADKRVSSLDEGSERSGLLLKVGYLLQRSVLELQEPESRLHEAKDLFEQVLLESSEREHTLNAHLLIGRCLELVGSFAPALRATSKALFIAQELQMDQYIYQAEWQLGRILHATGGPGSEAAYRRAIAALAKVKPQLLASSTGVFRTQIAPVYREYADLLLSNAARQAPDQRGDTLRDVVAVLERLKQSEVEDYYSRECVAVRSLGDGSGVDYGASAIIYPIILDDRVEVISEVGGELIHHTVSISRVAITELIRSLRIDLERPMTEGTYLQKSQKLYELILSHLEEPLARNKIRTLVFVPDGPLRTIPPSVLHDGRQHLVERMSIVIQPAMSLLTDEVEHGENRMVAGGISKKVEGFARLPAVGEELRRLPAMNSGRILENEMFTIGSIEGSLSDKSFSTAHLATHGEFNEDFRRTFILTWDGRLSVNRLQSMLQTRPGDRPLELLVLSACQTAAGDDRAALGLAGIAVQSGARSALASLWSISDTATATLMADFYDGLFSGGLGKAESLRRAQLNLMRIPRYRHPSYWAPYVLTGEWR